MMDTNEILSGCACCGVSRRGFLAAGCAACAGALGLSVAAPSIVFGATDKFRLRIVYALHAEKQPGPDWPNVGFDFGPVMARINKEVGKACPQFELIPTMATGEEQAKKILEEDKAGRIDGYIVYQMNAWNQVVQTLATSGKPVLYADFQYGGSGGFLVYNAAFIRAKAPNVGFVASSHMKDFIAAVRCFDVVRKGGSAADFVAATAKARMEHTPKYGRLDCKPDPLKTLPIDECIERMKAARILAVQDQNTGPLEPIMGIPIEKVSFDEVNNAWKNADKDEARAVAEGWRKNAAKVAGVSQETLETSAAMYIGMKAVIKKHNATGLTMNCLGGFYGGHIHAYPCLGFYELNNEALVGGCECDIRSAATMTAFGILTQGRPGYISDPVIDTAKRQIIYAHCVSSNKAFGPNGRTNPYQILTHSEDRKGASVRSILPIGYMTTTLEVAPDRKELLFHQAKAVANDPDDRACRTKLCGEPIGDIEKLFGEWDHWGWHRVTFYGDIKEPVFALADKLGYKIIQEA